MMSGRNRRPNRGAVRSRRLLQLRVFFNRRREGRASHLIFSVKCFEFSQIHTLDISKDEVTGCMFRDKAESRKITSWTGDSGTFDFSPWKQKVDLVYVDGSHEYEAVKFDSQVAFELVAKEGCIIWDDFLPSWPGVARALRESPRSAQLRRIAGTKLVCHLEAA